MINFPLLTGNQLYRLMMPSGFGLQVIPKWFYLAIVLAVISGMSHKAYAQTGSNDNFIVVTFASDRNELKKIKWAKETRLQLLMSDHNLALYNLSRRSLFVNKVRNIRIQYLDSSANKVSIRKGRAQIKQLAGKLSSGGSGYDSCDIIKRPWQKVVSKEVGPGISNLKVRVGSRWFRRTTFEVDTLPVAEAIRLPALDTEPCIPFDRFLALKEIRGYGPGNFFYMRYYQNTRKIIHKIFDIYFERDKTDMVEEDYSEIVKYLKENNLSILHASIEGYSSVEGLKERNERLHRKRADLLVAILQELNNEPILVDTVIFAEAWNDFYKDIALTSFQWLDTLSEDSIRVVLNDTPGLLSKLEPLLKTHRKGLLKLALAARFTDAELLDRVKTDLTKYAMLLKLRPGQHQRKEAEARILGIYRYMDEMIALGKFTYDDLASVIDNNYMASHLRILYFYHFIKVVEGAKKASSPVEPLDSIFTRRHWNNVFEVASNNIISLISDDYTESRPVRIRQAVDIQYYTIKFIQSGILNPDILCTFLYPDEYIYYGLKLQQYAMLQTLSEGRNLPCFHTGNDDEAEDNVVNDDESLHTFLLEARNRDLNFFSVYDSANGRFYSAARGDYYAFVRRMIMSNNRSIQAFVHNPDNLIEFDLYYLLRTNINHWDPVNNFYYDSLLPVKELYKLIRTLKSVHRRVCSRDVNQLYLDYYLKYLIHLQNNTHEKDSGRKADESMFFITGYYQKNTPGLFKEILVYVSDVINNFYWLPSRQPSTQYAFNLLKSQAGRERFFADLEWRLSKYRKHLALPDSVQMVKKGS